jgi:hypothetical protein
MEENKIIAGEFIPFFMAPPCQSHILGLDTAIILLIIRIIFEIENPYGR